MPPCAVVIHVALIDEHSGDGVDVMIPWVHCNAKEEGREGTAHVDAHVKRERGAEAGAYFMKNLSPKKNVPTID